MLIARKEMFGLISPRYICEHIYKTHELEIVKYYKYNEYDEEDEEHCFVIATFNEEGEVVSCGDRLFKEIETQTELQWVTSLIQIAELIICQTDNVVRNGDM